MHPVRAALESKQSSRQKELHSQPHGVLHNICPRPACHQPDTARHALLSVQTVKEQSASHLIASTRQSTEVAQTCRARASEPGQKDPQFLFCTHFSACVMLSNASRLNCKNPPYTSASGEWRI